jgi:thiamine biosynthesis lipoprotein
LEPATAIDDRTVHVLYGETMGTRWRACVVAGARVELAPLHDAIQAALDGVVAQMSTWEPASDISRYNRAGAGSVHALPQAFAGVLRCALEVAEASGGAFDPTIGPLVALWGFGAHGGGHRVPDEREIAETMPRVGWRRIALGDDGVLAQPGGVSLDLSAIAKGHGVDAVVDRLRARGIGAALVDVGGELRGYGRKPDGAAWQVLVEAAPDAEDDAPCVLALDDAAVATSGVRWHRFDHDGRRYAHTINPRSGAPVAQAPAAVTVVAGDAMRADAWATALTVMGIERGFAFACERGLAARFVAEDGETLATPAFEARLAR